MSAYCCVQFPLALIFLLCSEGQREVASPCRYMGTYAETVIKFMFLLSLCGPKDTPQITQRLPYFLQRETRASLSGGSIWLLIASISVHQRQRGTPWRGQSTRGNKDVGNVWERGFEAETDMNREAVLKNTAACRHDKTGQRNCQKLMLCGEG